MPGGHFERSDDHRRTNFQETSPSSPAPDELAPDMLRQVVAETASSLARSDEADPALQAAMIEVARRFAGQPLTLDPAGTALLEAVLRLQFPVFAGRPALLIQTSRTVAASLLADPAARLRVEHLWARLAENVA